MDSETKNKITKFLVKPDKNNHHVVVMVFTVLKTPDVRELIKHLTNALYDLEEKVVN